MSITVTLTAISLLALLFSSTRFIGLVLTAILFSAHPWFYTAAVLIVGAAYFFFYINR